MEVLVTLVVISLALLGTAGLQTFSVKVSQGGQFRSQAVVLGLDIVERMEANNAGTIAGNYVSAGGGKGGGRAVNCAGVMCTPANLANYDLSELQAKLDEQLPGSSYTITAVAPAGPPTYTYEVSINWVERITKQANAQATGNNANATENFSYTFRRTFIDRSKTR
jgi:type IV pilus assembly protein PilV